MRGYAALMADARARDFDIVVFGASGFVGRLVAEHLAARAADLRIALAGRSAERVAAVRAELGPAAAQWPIIVADSGDTGSVAAMAASTRVVATTVGPYARYGLPLVAACVQAGTDYVDLTGEVLFVRDSADRHHDRARDNAVRIVHSCGFDSVPSDLGVWLCADAAASDDAGRLAWATLVARSVSGGFSGGTIASLIGQLDERGDPARRRLADDPYALSPDRAAEPDLGAQPATTGPRWDPELRMWTGPFVMAGFNTRVVRRSNALQDWAYGRRLRYREVVGFGGGWAGPLAAMALTAGLVAGNAALRFRPARSLVNRVVPSPGEGPDEQTRRGGHFSIDVHACTVTGARYRATIAAQGDPGYAATSVMLGESALALVADRGRLPDAAGVLTPATGIGPVLAGRLRAAGFRLDVERTG
jgi:short subunit dehydrogenase-like uncharacterized protein